MEMTQEWIKQFNEKCAEFLGIQIGYFKDEIDCPVAEYQWMCVSANCKYQFEKEDYPNKSVYDYLKFHSDWNWIMEVVDKIHSVSHEVTPHDWFSLIEFNAKKNQVIGRIGLGNKGKEGTLQVIDQFIDWYNKQKGYVDKNS